jgi:imidazolonepropionase-like amidohydrolase
VLGIGLAALVRNQVVAAYGTHVAAHAHGTQGIVNACLAGARSVEHGSLLDDEAAALLAERGVYLVAVPGYPLDDLGLLADVPLVMQGGRVLKAPVEMRLPTGPI